MGINEFCADSSFRRISLCILAGSTAQNGALRVAGGEKPLVLGWVGCCEWFEKFSGFEFAAVKSDV